MNIFDKSDPKIAEALDLWLPRRIYHAGETIRGKVLLHLTEGVKTTAIRVSFEGIEKGILTSFYFAAVETLLGAEPGKEKDAMPQILEVGDHTFDFKFQLPEDLPFNIEESKFCRVYFRAIATVITAKSTNTKEEEFQIEPLEYYDLSKVPTSTLDARKKSGLTMMATTETNYCVGDTMKIFLRIRKSETKKVTLNEAVVKLYEKRLRKGPDTTEEYSTLISENKLNLKIRKNDQYIEKMLDVPIPFTSLPNSFTKWGLFSVFHELDVELAINWRPNLRLKIPITIYPPRYYPGRSTLSLAIKNLVNTYIDLNGRSEAIELATEQIIERFPALGADVFLDYVCSLLDAKDVPLNNKLNALRLLDDCSKKYELGDFVQIGYYNSSLKKCLSKRTNGRAEAISGSQDLPPEEEVQVEDGNGDPLVDVIVRLVRRWSANSLKWKEGPYLELAKKGAVLSDQLSFIASPARPKPIDLEAFDLPYYVQDYLFETMKNVTFMEAINEPEDYPADITELVAYVAAQLSQSLMQLKKLSVAYEQDKERRAAIDVFEFVYKKAKAAIKKSEDVKASVTKVTLSDDEEKGKRLSKHQEKLMDLLNKRAHEPNFYTSAFEIPIAKLANLIQTSNFDQEKDKPVALLDLSQHGSAKNGVIIGEKGIYFHNGAKAKVPGSGFLSYSDFLDSVIATSDNDEVSLAKGCSINVRYCKMRIDELLALFEALQNQMAPYSFVHEREGKVKEKKSKKEKKTKKSNEETTETKDEPKGQSLINFDD